MNRKVFAIETPGVEDNHKNVLSANFEFTQEYIDIVLKGHKYILIHGKVYHIPFDQLKEVKGDGTHRLNLTQLTDSELRELNK